MLNLYKAYIVAISKPMVADAEQSKVSYNVSMNNYYSSPPIGGIIWLFWSNST